MVPHFERYTVLAEKSTVPVGTAEWIRRTAGWTAPGAEFDVASNPEFLREGQAVRDTLRPDRIVVGANSERAHDRLRELYRPILDASGCPYVATDVATAEIIKLASNALLAAKISFINSVADVCEAAGADVEIVSRAMGLDPRIGPDFLRAGLGYGGFCLPKDVAAFQHKARELGVEFGILAEVARVNEGRVEAVLAKLRTILWNLEGKRIAVWGLAFKAGTDDLRAAPALALVRALREGGAEVVGFDPVANDAATKEVPDLALAHDPVEAATGADAVVVATEWAVFQGVDLSRLRDAMAQRHRGRAELAGRPGGRGGGLRLREHGAADPVPGGPPGPRLIRQVGGSLLAHSIVRRRPSRRSTVGRQSRTRSARAMSGRRRDGSAGGRSTSSIPEADPVSSRTSSPTSRTVRSLGLPRLVGVRLTSPASAVPARTIPSIRSLT
jgi:nucleotide sugar dehydrogenase